MSRLTLQQILSGVIEPIQPKQQDPRPVKNPFMEANGLNIGLTQEQGVNKPLRHPMFVGYRDNKPIYAGSRLFVLY